MPFGIFKFKIVRRRVRRRRSPTLKSHAIYLEHRMKAMELVTTRLPYFNAFYNFTYNRVTIKNQSSRWGSCSRKGNINFNYRIALIAPELADYIIVHELCHLGQLNHSRKFWELVEKTMPNWRELRRRLKSEEGNRVF